jgi:hypothetical protein
MKSARRAMHPTAFCAVLSYYRIATPVQSQPKFRPEAVIATRNARPNLLILLPGNIPHERDAIKSGTNYQFIQSDTDPQTSDNMMRAMNSSL